VCGFIAHRGFESRSLRQVKSAAVLSQKKGPGECPSPWIWWSWGELNPRPQAFFEWFYMLSRLIEFSFKRLRSGTPPSKPVTLCLAPRQVTRRDASLREFPCSKDALRHPYPARWPAVARLAGFKQRVRNVRRLQLLCFQRFYEVTEPRHAPLRVRTHVEASTAPWPVVYDFFSTPSKSPGASMAWCAPHGKLACASPR
jgi:hypothetical protein